MKKNSFSLLSDNSNNEEIITTHIFCKSKAVFRILNKEFEGSTSVTHLHYTCSQNYLSIMEIRNYIIL